MRAARRTKRSRRGFTLIEMLAVVAIISVLVSLVTAAAYMARVRVKIARIAMEAKQLEAACLAYRERFGELPPDGTEDVDVIRRHLRKAFPLWTASDSDINTLVANLDPSTALMFFLGGPQDTNGRPIGFSPNPRNPFALTPTEGRIGPFYEFKRDQISTVNTFRYFPPGVNKNNELGVFVYFRAEDDHASGDEYLESSASGATIKGWDLAADGSNDAVPLRDGRIAAATRPWINPDSCQIICGGLDGRMGTGTNFPDGTAVGTYTAFDDYRWDDQANFTDGTFEDARE